MATKTEKNVQLKINKMTKNIFDQLSVQGLISEDQLYLLSDDETGSATWGTIGGELSNQTDLKVMLDSKADKSEIPTVNNPTITFTQGNAVKGRITLNQANNQAISLDAGGGGGGDIPADLSCNNLSVGTSVSLGLGSTASGEYGSIAQGAYSKATANAAVALGSQCEATAQMSYAIGYRAEAMHQKSMVLALADHNFPTAQSYSYNTLNIYVGDGYATDNALDYIFVNGQALKSNIEGIIASAPVQFYFYSYDIGDYTQQGSNIQFGTSYSYFNTGIICFEVEYIGGKPLCISYTDPNTNNQQTLEYYLSPVDYSGNTVGAIVTVPCVFGPGVNVYNNYSTDMKVRKLYRIEFK